MIDGNNLWRQRASECVLSIVRMHRMPRIMVGMDENDSYVGDVDEVRCKRRVKVASAASSRIGSIW